MDEQKCDRCGGAGLEPLPRLGLCSAAMSFLAAGCVRDPDGRLLWNCPHCGGTGRVAAVVDRPGYGLPSYDESAGSRFG